jgi:hypothetical protein
VPRVVCCIGVVVLTVLLATACGGASGEADGTVAGKADWLPDVFQVVQAELGDSITLNRIVVTPKDATFVEVEFNSVTAYKYDTKGEIVNTKKLRETTIPGLLFQIYEVEPEAPSRILATIESEHGPVDGWTSIAERDRYQVLRWRTTVTSGGREQTYTAASDGTAVKPLRRG